MRVAFYPGCVAKGACPELYQSTLKVADRLGIELVELKNASCCGAGVIHEADPDLALAINARTFSMAEELGLPIMTICGTCQGVMSGCNKRLKDDSAARERINGMLQKDGRPYGGTVDVKHLLWILVKEYGMEALKAFVRRPLRGLKVAPFYGCYILRPSSSLGFDDPANPRSLEKVIEILGADVVEYGGRTKCCGFPVILEREPIATEMAGINELDAKKNGADCMVTPCPLCHMSLDIYQEKSEKIVRQTIGMPILHFPQLLGLGMGFSPKDLGMTRHMVSTEAVKKKIDMED